MPLTISDAAGDSVDRALELESLDVDMYRSIRLWKPANGRGAFGGQVIGQATMAATMSVDPAMQLHSLHCYFLTFGDVEFPVLYNVDRIRSGRSYATRTVKAMQRGKCIFTMTCSFQIPEPEQIVQNLPMPSPFDAPSFPEPEACQATEERIAHFMMDMEGLLPDKIKSYLQTLMDERRQSRIEIRSAMPDDYADFWQGNLQSNEQAFWIRSRSGLLREDDAFRRCVIAFISDFHLIGTAAKALGLNTRDGRRLAMMASLDHSLHFYASIDPSDWMLYHMTFQASGSGRAVVHGAIYNREGKLAALAHQEGVVRAQPPRVSGGGGGGATAKL